MKSIFRHLIEWLVSGFGYKLQPTNFVHWPSQDLEFTEICSMQSHFGWPGNTGPKFDRMYIVKELMMSCQNLNGCLAECGVFKGSTSLVMAEYARRYFSSKNERRILLYDSFEGLSPPTKEDEGTIFVGNDYECSLESVKQNLSEYPDLIYRKGWIPNCFSDDSELAFAFVHIDVDFYQPVLSSIEFFYPRLVPGGIIVFDDYGSIETPGAKTACDEYCNALRIPVIKLASGQAFIQKAFND